MEFTFDYKNNNISSCKCLHWRFIMLAFLGFLIFLVTLCCAFFPFKMIDNYFLLLPLSLSLILLSTFALLLSITLGSCFRFSLVDFLFVVIVGYYAIRYDYQLQLGNWKIIYAFLLLLLWFAARVIFSCAFNLKSSFSFALICVGAVLAIWGLLQLYGFQKSNHVLFSITGPFYNPGPYSGYIAMIIPLCLDRLLVSKGFLRYFYGFAFFLILSIIPAGMSRSAWLAVIVSCLWLLTVRLNWIKKIKQYAKKHPYVVSLYSFLILVTMLIVFFCFFQIKSASANGRLFIWKNTITAILKQPIWGYGAGSFPSVYGHTQATYFSSNDYAEIEEYVAGSPEYAFNECLQMCMEGGLFLLLIVLIFLIVIVKQGIYTKEYGICANLLSLFIFSMFSYPSQELSFGVVAIFSLAVCISNEKKQCDIQKNSRRKVYQILILFMILTGNCGISFILRDSKYLADRWYYATNLRSKQILNAAVDVYDGLFDKLKHNSRFLLDYSKCLSLQENFSEANVVLERAKKVSCDPILRNIQGCNYQTMGLFLESESCFKESSYLIPIRIYPYYLLAKLYSEPQFLDTEKARQMANIVLTKEPKIYNKAIDEMRAEMTILLSDLFNESLIKKCKEDEN